MKNRALLALLLTACASSAPRTATLSPTRPGWSMVASQKLPVRLELPEPVTESTAEIDGQTMTTYAGRDGDYSFGLSVVQVPTVSDEAGQEKARESTLRQAQDILFPDYAFVEAGPVLFSGYPGLRISLSKRTRTGQGGGRGMRTYYSDPQLKAVARAYVQFIGPYLVIESSLIEAHSALDWPRLAQDQGGIEKVKDRLNGVYLQSFSKQQNEMSLQLLKKQYPAPRLAFQEQAAGEGWTTVSVPADGVSLDLPGEVTSQVWYNRAGHQVWSVRGGVRDDKAAHCRLTYIRGVTATEEELLQYAENEQGESASGPRQNLVVQGLPAIDLTLQFKDGPQLYRLIRGPGQVVRLQVSEGTQKPLGERAKRCLDSVRLGTLAGPPPSPP